MAHYIATTDITDEIAVPFLTDTAAIDAYLSRVDSEIVSACKRVGVWPGSIPVDINGRTTCDELRWFGLACFYALLFSDKMFAGSARDPHLDKYKLKVEFYTFDKKERARVLSSAVILGFSQAPESRLTSSFLIRG